MNYEITCMLKKKDHVNGMIIMSWIGIAAFVVFVAAVGIIEYFS